MKHLLGVVKRNQAANLNFRPNLAIKNNPQLQINEIKIAASNMANRGEYRLNPSFVKQL